jgi:hypothetical protein
MAKTFSGGISSGMACVGNDMHTLDSAAALKAYAMRIRQLVRGRNIVFDKILGYPLFSLHSHLKWNRFGYVRAVFLKNKAYPVHICQFCYRKRFTRQMRKAFPIM